MAVVTQEYVDIPVGDLAMRTFVAAPRSPGPHPAIVFYSDIFQLTEPTLRWCVRLASYGFLVAAPEIYHRIEPSGTVLEFDDEGKARGQRDADATPVAHFDM
jgi:carboxymethylenebutenolidase